MPSVFPLEPDNREPFVEELIYTTTIWAAWSGVEQRRSLRQTPNLRFTYSTLTEGGQQVGLLPALVWGGQAREWLVPYWPGAKQLTANVANTDTVINVQPTAYAQFLTGRAAMLWESPLRWQHRLVSTVGANSVTLGAPVTGAWLRTANVMLVPLFLGLLAPIVDAQLETFNAESVRLTFDIKVGAALPYTL